MLVARHRCCYAGVATGASATAARPAPQLPGAKLNARQYDATRAALVVAPYMQPLLDDGGLHNPHTAVDLVNSRKVEAVIRSTPAIWARPDGDMWVQRSLVKKAAEGLVSRQSLTFVACKRTPSPTLRTPRQLGNSQAPG